MTNLLKFKFMNIILLVIDIYSGTNIYSHDLLFIFLDRPAGCDLNTLLDQPGVT